MKSASSRKCATPASAYQILLNIIATFLSMARKAKLAGNKLALSPKAVNNERTPPTLARDLGRGLATCALQEAHMTKPKDSRQRCLRHPIPPYPGARPLPGAPS